MGGSGDGVIGMITFVSPRAAPAAVSAAAGAGDGSTTAGDKTIAWRDVAACAIVKDVAKATARETTAPARKTVFTNDPLTRI